MSEIRWKLRRLKYRVGDFLASLFGLSTYMLRVFKVSHGSWCDYCSCKGCQEGLEQNIIGPQYECADGSHICSVCFYVEPCVVSLDWTKKHGQGGCWFCADAPYCRHKPKLKNPPEVVK